MANYYEKLEKLRLKTEKFLCESGSISFGDKKESDEKFAIGVNGHLNFDLSFSDQRYRNQWGEIFINAVKTYAYKRHAIDAMVGIGRSGTVISLTTGAISQHLQEELKEENGLELKSYRWAGVDNSGEFIGQINDGDKICIIDECLITGNSITEGIGRLYAKFNDLSFPLVIVALDVGLANKEKKEYYVETLSGVIKEKFNKGHDVKIESITSIEEILCDMERDDEIKTCCDAIKVDKADFKLYVEDQRNIVGKGYLEKIKPDVYSKLKKNGCLT